MSRADTLTVAAINATVVSIFVAAAAIYVSARYSALVELKERTFHTASRVAHIPGSVLLASVGVSTDDYDLATEEGRWEALDRLRVLVYDVNNAQGPPEQRGKEALVLLGNLMAAYPWAGMDFRTVADVEDWIGQFAVFNMHMSMSVRPSFGPKLDDIVQPFLDSELQLPSVAAFGGPPPHLESYTSMMDQIESARPIVREVMVLVDNLKAYQRRLPSRWFLAVSLLLAGAAFLAGVIFPVLATSPPRWLFTWAPASFYTLVFAFLLWLVLRGASGRTA